MTKNLALLISLEAIPSYYQGERATLLRVVVHGKIKLVRHTLEGKDVLLDMLKPGEFFGSLSALLAGVFAESVHMAGGMLVHELSVMIVIFNGMRLRWA